MNKDSNPINIDAEIELAKLLKEEIEKQYTDVQRAQIKENNKIILEWFKDEKNKSS